MRTLPLLIVASCVAPEPVDFGDPALLGPLEADNLAPEVPAEGGEPFPESMTLAAGEDEDADHYWAHARGWVHADSARVWAALRELDVMVDRRAVDEWELVEDNVLPEFDFSFLIAHTVNDVFTVSYDLTWVFELQQGSVEVPEQVVARWDKTDGTPFIDLLSGSVLLRRVDSGLTEVQLMEHLRATSRDEEELERVLTDLFADLVAASHGEALPQF